MGLENCHIVKLPKISDGRGELTFVEKGNNIPFTIERLYYLYNIPPGERRGFHAHKELHQLIISIKGRFKVKLDDGYRSAVYLLDDPRYGLYICPMIWRELFLFSQDAICLVLASSKYEEADYIRNYKEFFNFVKGE